MRIKVTQMDIDEGSIKNAFECPIARALLRKTGKVWHVGQYYVEDAHGDKLFRLSPAARTFIENFDGKKPVRPAIFILKETP